MALLLVSCSSDDDAVRVSDDRLIDKLGIEIAELIESSACTDQSQCDYIAFGSKPCGGPWGYLIYSTSIDVDLLHYKVNLYNQLQREYNQRYRIVSDCALVNPPSALLCEDGKCVAAD